VVADDLKEALLRVAAVALNPMLVGSGTNMKMLDYLAAGVPVVSTPVGVRGLDLDHERDLRVVEPAEFAAAIRATLSDPDSVVDARAREVRREIEQRFDWTAVAAPLRGEIEPRDPAGNRVAPQRSAISA